MSNIIEVQNIKDYLSRFDRIFISASCFTSGKIKVIAETLVHAYVNGYIKEGCLVLNKLAIDAGNKCSQYLKILDDNKLIRQKSSGQRIQLTTTYLLAAKKLSEMKYKLLLITDNESEGIAFKKLDYEDNHVNDLHSCCFTNEGKVYNYVYNPPIENLLFKINIYKPVQELKVLFHKSLINDKYQCLYNENDIKSHAKKVSNSEYKFIINKYELFESDKIQFVVVVNGLSYYSDKIDYYLSNDQLWVIDIINNKVVCKSQEDSEDIFDTNNEIIEQKNDAPINKLKYYGGQKAYLPVDRKIDTYIPVTGDTVYSTSKKSINLTKQLGGGGEGVVYDTNLPNIVVKILNNNTADNLTVNKKEKIEFMVKNRIDHPNVIWPIEAVYNSSNVFVGYTMTKLTNTVELWDIICKQINPNVGFGILNLTKTQILEMIISLLETMVYLHERNIIIGDIKFKNFMIKNNDPTKVYFVDCDGYQIDKFPATMISSGYTAPELIGKTVREVYRTFGNENYAIFAVLMYILVCKNEKVYSMGNNKKYEISEEQLASKGMFPFFLDENKTSNYLKIGYPLVNWSHLPGYIKKAFVNVGAMNGKNFGEDKRLSSKEWLVLFKHYLNDLKNGKLNKDPDCNVGYHDPRSQPISYSLVDIEYSTIVTSIQREFSLEKCIDKILTIAKIVNKVDLIKLIVQTLSECESYKDKNIKILLKKNLGVLYEVEY